ncbi:hypothetical protein [Bradyrhizobium sp. JR3.5]
MTKKKGRSAGALTGRSAALARLAAGTNPNDSTAADKVRRMLNIVKDPQSEAQGDTAGVRGLHALQDLAPNYLRTAS